MPHMPRIPPRSHAGRRTGSVSCRVSVSSPLTLFPALRWKRTPGRPCPVPRMSMLCLPILWRGLLSGWGYPTAGAEGEGPAEETPFPAHRWRNRVLILGPGEAGADEEFLAADG